MGSYFLARRAVKQEPTDADRHSVADVRLDNHTARLDTIERELRQEIRALEARLTTLSAEALTMEEFQAYTNMDGQRREQLIAKIGELQGSLAAVFSHMRK